MRLTNLIGPALLGTCLYGAVANSFPTNEEKDAIGDADATNAVERAACAAALGLKTTLGLTQGEIVAAIRGAGGESVDGRVEVKNVERGAGEDCLETPRPRAGGGTVLGRPQWGIRGAWEDDYYQAFGADWVFPFGTNHLAGVVVYSQGGLAASSYDEPFVSLPVSVAIVPREGWFTVEQTASNSYVFAWRNIRPGRTATETLDAQIELFRNGDYCVSTNGIVVEHFVRENPFPFAPVGQDDWYREWVDEMVGVGLENGLYKFTASFPVDPPEATLLRVGEESVVVTNAGEYVFLLEKGREYEFDTKPYDATVEYDMCDDIAPCEPMMLGWWGDGSGEWTVDGGEKLLSLPSLFYCGTCLWWPTFRGAPDVPDLTMASFPMTFSALLSDCCMTSGVTYRWFVDTEEIYIASPYSQTTLVDVWSTFGDAQFTLAVEAYTPDRTYRSTLTPIRAEPDRREIVLSVPDTFFVNNDDDNDDGVLDCDQWILPDGSWVRDDDITRLEIGFPAGESRIGTLWLYDRNGFDGLVYESAIKHSTVGLGSEWELTRESPSSLALDLNAFGRSEYYESSRICLRWTPDGGGPEEMLVSRFTVVEPVVEPICSEPKTFPLKVVENVSVPIAVCILSNNGTLMRDVADVYAMLPKVNDIYEQVGMSFYIESVVVTNLPFACSPVYEGPSRPRNWSFDKVANLLPDGNGLKCYFISEFVDAVKTVAANDDNGMLLSRQADAQVWAHEIGHACNLRDIYYDENGVSISSEESFEWRHAPQDWNNGSYGENTKGSRYYRKNLTHKEAILTLLMYGYKTKTALDITSGKVEGVINISEDVSTIGDARTGVFASEATRSPRHIRKGEEK